MKTFLFNDKVEISYNENYEITNRVILQMISNDEFQRLRKIEDNPMWQKEILTGRLTEYDPYNGNPSIYNINNNTNITQNYHANDIIIENSNIINVNKKVNAKNIVNPTLSYKLKDFYDNYIGKHLYLIVIILGLVVLYKYKPEYIGKLILWFASFVAICIFGKKLSGLFMFLSCFIIGSLGLGFLFALLFFLFNGYNNRL